MSPVNNLLSGQKSECTNVVLRERENWRMSHTSTGPKTEPTGRRKSRGQSVVELAIITPILLLMLVGVFDLGRALSAYMTVGNAAGAGASYGMGVEGATEVDIRGVVQADAGSIWGKTLDDGDIDVEFRTATGNRSGFLEVEVMVTYEFEPLLGFGPLADSMQIQRRVIMPVLNPPAESGS